VGEVEYTHDAGPWAVRRFGARLAAELVWRVPLALAAAVGRAMDAHEASGLSTNHAFGNARWPGQYEELIRQLIELPGARKVRPHAAFYELVVVEDHLFVPWCPGDSGRRPGRIVRELLRRFGPARRYRQAALFSIGSDDTGPLDDLGFVPRVTLIEYACDARAGLTELAWGEATCDDQGEVIWHHRERLLGPATLGIEIDGPS
jgi:hypothetical protein